MYPYKARKTAVLYSQSAAVLVLLPSENFTRCDVSAGKGSSAEAPLRAGLCDLFELPQKEDPKLNKSLVPSCWLSW